MLDLTTRSAILRLRQEGHGTRLIAKAMGTSRGAVLRVLSSNQAEVPALERVVLLDSGEAKVKELFNSCKGNVVRVHEELVASGVFVAYATVTRYCRTLELGMKTKVAAGVYDFPAGEEMQHGSQGPKRS